ncbi:MalY/PatB family protein [Ornithinimicrobium sp. INDO-MA30-4]|uniref:MalY/PatB family protein n=1 Tax=Ornithinimicrobium sp. INDO-MA30-4 TaxID=2908651 RepID=UPI001F23FD53|nr:aminotransferase class I/II-fold pyridoxal phosphate-dependent enzyme [Ornithinimicrobium sp. INDO-MA30-4]UJH70644.1 aminotransferase class I/II-fold pyridoxal phosphate-dependent enzyme [Ornithinimicrobium sp. INDO-MA30-4]
MSDDHLIQAGPMKWALDEPGVIPAWIAEMDFAVAPAISEVVKDYVASDVFGYPDIRLNPQVIDAFVAFVDRRWGATIEPERVMITGDVMEGMRLVLSHIAPAGPVIVPTPVYPPFLVMTRDMGREVIEVQMSDDTPNLDLAAIEAAAANGAQALLLCQPHNPLGRVWTRDELTQIRDIARAYGVHVISDEIHAPLVWPGVELTSYASVTDETDLATVLMSATKSFNMPGLRCAQVVSSRAEDHETLSSLHPVLNHSMSTLGMRASIAAFTESDEWLDAVRTRSAENHALITALLADQLPEVSCLPAQATYLAWIDVSRVATDDPMAGALAAGVRLDGQNYGAGTDGHLRVNLATSSDRVREIVRRLSSAQSGWRAS